MGLGKSLKKSLGSLGSGSFLGTALGGGLGFMVGGPLGGAIGASLLGTAGANYDNNRAIDAQNAYNYALWQEQMAYNTPANQVARLREAGLNPNLFYSQGNPGNATSAPDMKAHQYNSAQFLDLANMYYQVKNLQAQNNNLNAQTDNIKAETAHRRTEAALKRIAVDFYRRYGVLPNMGVVPSLIKAVHDVGDPVASYSGDVAGKFVGESLLQYGDRGGKTTLTKSPYSMSKSQREYMVSQGYVYDANQGRWMKW